MNKAVASPSMQQKAPFCQEGTALATIQGRDRYVKENHRRRKSGWRAAAGIGLARLRLDSPLASIQNLTGPVALSLRLEKARPMANHLPTRWSHLSCIHCMTFPVLVLFGLAGCQVRPAPAAVSSEPKPPVVASDPDEPTRTIPADFDPSMPVFPGVTVERVRKPKGAMREIVMTTDAPVDELIEFYTSRLEKNGYGITSTLKVAARKIWSCDFHKGGRQASVMLYPSETGKSRVTVDLMYEMPARGNERPFPLEEQFDVVGPGEVAQKTQD